MSQPWLRASIKITKPIVLIDMDGVICDFDKRAKELEAQGIKVNLPIRSLSFAITRDWLRVIFLSTTELPMV